MADNTGKVQFTGKRRSSKWFYSPDGPTTEFAERRRGADRLTKAIQIFSAASWALVILFVVFFGLARPMTDDFFSRFFDGAIARGWDTFYLSVSLWLLIAVTAVCAGGIIINSRRHKRKSDRYNKSLIFFAVLSFIGIIAFLARFSGLLF